MKIGTFIGFTVGALSSFVLAKKLTGNEKETNKKIIKDKIIEMFE